MVFEKGSIYFFEKYSILAPYYTNDVKRGEILRFGLI